MSYNRAEGSAPRVPARSEAVRSVRAPTVAGRLREGAHVLLTRTHTRAIYSGANQTGTTAPSPGARFRTLAVGGAAATSRGKRPARRGSCSVMEPAYFPRRGFCCPLVAAGLTCRQAYIPLLLLPRTLRCRGKAPRFSGPSASNRNTKTLTETDKRLVDRPPHRGLAARGQAHARGVQDAAWQRALCGPAQLGPSTSGTVRALPA